MTRKEFAGRIALIDPEAPDSIEKLASLFEEDYLTEGRDLNDTDLIKDLRESAEADLRYFMEKYDILLQKINRELRKAGATEAQINWGLFENIELPTVSYYRCNLMVRKLIRCSYQIQYCLGELKMLSKYTDIDTRWLMKTAKEYGRHF